MNMPIYTTTSRKTVICPVWKEKICLNGKYRFSDKPGHEYEATFMYATCPILENLSLPKSKRNRAYDIFSFCDHQPCELLKDFKPVIDIRKGYSQ